MINIFDKLSPRRWYQRGYRDGQDAALLSIINQKKDKMIVLYEDDDCFYTFTAKKENE